MSHTKGPWSIEDPIIDQLWIVEAGKPMHDLRDIAVICVGDDYAWPAEVAAANARLIAAAPDLLEALEPLVNLLAGDQWSEAEIDVAFDVTGLGALVNKARAAIQKARGEA